MRVRPASLEQQQQIIRAANPNDLDAWGILDNLSMDYIEIEAADAYGLTNFTYDSSSGWIDRNTFLLKGILRIKVRSALVGKSETIEWFGGTLLYPFEATLRREDFPWLPPQR
jgi:hypothetical protein